MSQKDKILADLKRGIRITQLDAYMQYRCWRLASRINDLRNDGHDIKTEMAGSGKTSYARYYLNGNKSI